jgi:hypothetical protein
MVSQIRIRVMQRVTISLTSFIMGTMLGKFFEMRKRKLLKVGKGGVKGSEDRSGRRYGNRQVAMGPSDARTMLGWVV